MKISLIITTYNTPEMLEKVLESAGRQRRYPDEVVIADDGSGEETALVVRRFSRKAPFPVFHEWQEDRGFRLAKIRNEAIKRSSGEFIIMLDGDCVINRHFVSDHEALAEEGYFIQGKRILVGRNAVGLFDHRHVNSARVLLRLALTGELSNVHHLVRLPSYPALRNRDLKNIKGCNMSFFRRDILAVNGYDEDFVGWGNEDSDLVFRFFNLGLRKKVHPFMAVCFHLWHPTNKTLSSGNRQRLEQTLRSNEYFCRNGLSKKD